MNEASLHPDVAAVRRLHAPLHARVRDGMAVSDWIEEQAQTLHEAHARGNPDATVQLRNGLPRAASLDPAQVLAAPLDLEEARLAVRREHGFTAPPGPGAGRLEPAFEECLDELVAGRLDGLRAALRQRPDLVLRRSSFGHRATLLHYLVANGTEIWRQEVSVRAPHAAVILLEAGAEVDATASVYGGEFTALQLLDGSEHPRRMGVARDLGHVFRAAGAKG